MIPPVLQVQGISKKYPGVIAAHDISFEIRSGEILGLVGKNGAGKSTLIKILGGVTQPDAGEIFIGGSAKVFRNPIDSTTNGIAIVHQEFAVVPQLSVAENIFLGLGYPKLMHGLIDATELCANAAAVLSEIGMEAINPRHEMQSLSIADQRMVMIARGLSAKARVLLLDEPTASLTDSEVKVLFRVLRQLSASGTAIIYVSHRLEEIFELTSRVIVMRDGGTHFDGATHDLDNDTMIQLIVGGDSTALTDRRRNSRKVSPLHNELEAIRIEHVRRDEVVSDISFSAKHGEIVGFAGLVGSGRTELMRLIFGADRRDGGKIFIDGVEVSASDPRRAMDAGIVFLPEDRRQQGLVMDFDIRKNITLASLRSSRRRALVPIPSREREVLVTDGAIRRLNIKANGPTQETKTLSGGNQQKVVLGKWLERTARVFIFDEPTHGVDVGAKEEIYIQMESLAASGHCILFISSEFSELVGVCNRVLVLREGRLVGELTGEEISEHRMLEMCYGANQSI